MDGSNPKRLTQKEDEYFPTCSPDGKWVLYSRLSPEGKLKLWKVSIDGGDPIQVNDHIAIKPVISPDGKWIAYRTTGNQPGAGPKLAIASFDSGQPSKLFDIPQIQYRWSADGKAILYLYEVDGVANVWSQAVEGGAP